MQMPLLPGMVDGIGSPLMQRRQLYAGPMSKLRLLMICRMAKPEEVLIVEDENGNIVRETMKDNDVLVQYKVGIFIFALSDSMQIENSCVTSCMRVTIHYQEKLHVSALIYGLCMLTMLASKTNIICMPVNKYIFLCLSLYKFISNCFFL